MNSAQQPSASGASRPSRNLSGMIREVWQFFGLTEGTEWEFSSSPGFLPEFLRLLLLFALMFLVLGFVFPSVLPRALGGAIGLGLSYGIGSWLNKRGHSRIAAIALLATIFVVVSVLAFTAGGIYAPAFAAYPIIVLASGLLLGARASWIATSLTIVMGAALEHWATGENTVWRMYTHSPRTYLATMVGLLLTFVTLIRLYFRNLARAARQASDELRERRRVAAQLAASEAMLSTILDSTKDFILACDRQLRITALNKPLREFLLTSLEIEATSGYPVMDLIEPARRPAVGDVFRRVMAGESLALIHEWTTKEGRRLYFVESYSPILASDGTIDGVTVYTRDMSDWIRMDHALQQSEERLRTVVANAPVIMFATDAEGVFRLSEGKGLEALGLRPGEVVGKSAFDFYRDNPDVLQSIRRVLGGEEHVMTANIAGLYFETYWAPLRSPEGTVIGMIGVATDITQKRQSMEKLMEQASLIERAHDAIVVKDIEGRITFWNREAERLFGWSPEEVRGREEREITHAPEQEEKLQQALRATLAVGEWNGELLQRTRTGREVLVDSRWSLITDDAGRPKSILSINIDITEKKSLERQLLRSQRLEGLGTLAGGIAHDLNNILTPILMSVEMLRMRHDDARTKKALDAMESGAQRGADILRQLLAFARGMKGDHVSVDPSPLILEIETIMRSSFPKSIDIHVRVDSALRTVMADPTQIHQVLLNLALNARDSIVGPGTVSVTGSNVELTDSDARLNADAHPGSYVRLSVADTGCGIPKESIEKIFDPFFSTKEVGKGTGLGLSTVLTIVKNHGGFVTVESEVGGGSTFRVFLPAANPAGTASPKPVPDLPMGKGELVLIVDDEEIVREITAETLQNAGYQVEAVSSGAKALEFFSANRDVALVITDLMMPELGGRGLYEALRAEGTRVPVVFTSGFVSADTREREGLDPSVPFLEKPWEMSDLVRIVRELAGPPPARGS